MEKQLILMGPKDIERFARRMSIQIWERLREDKAPLFIGLNKKGFALAEQVGGYLGELLEQKVDCSQFNVLEAPSNQELPDCTDRHVILIDDVIFSGKTMFEAISVVCKRFEPSLIQTLVLIDRGHRRYPITSDIVGRYTPTKKGEHIEVMINKNRLGKVILFKNS